MPNRGDGLRSEFSNSGVDRGKDIPRGAIDKLRRGFHADVARKRTVHESH